MDSLARLRLRVLAIFILATTLVGQFLAGLPAAAELDPAEVNRAIDGAIKFLKNEQIAKTGGWDSSQGKDATALCTLALLNAGVPPSDPALKKALEYLRRPSTEKDRWVYVVSLELMVFAVADPKADVNRILENCKYLVKTQIKTGNDAGKWSYQEAVPPGDNSNTQFALLGLYEAERALERLGVESPIPRSTWDLSLKFFQDTQFPDGAWDYGRGESQKSLSMTCAGLTALIICNDRLNSGAATVNGDDVKCCGQATPDEQVELAFRWIGRSFQDREPDSTDLRISKLWMYYVYGLERVGRLSARRFLVKSNGDKHDWFREITEGMMDRNVDEVSGAILGRQGFASKQVDTALALLFLGKGRRPLLCAKLMHGGSGKPGAAAPVEDWNHHPNDVANLTRYVESQWEEGKKGLTWNVIDAATATADDYAQAPVLFLTGTEATKLAANDPAAAKARQELRTYLDRGGVLLADACCSDAAAFDESMFDLVKRMYEDLPNVGLEELSADHEVFAIEDKRTLEYVGKLWGVNVGCRTSIFYCRRRAADDPLKRGHLSCYWELAFSGRADQTPEVVQRRIDTALAVGASVAAYATNRKLKFKYEVAAKTRDNDDLSNLERAMVAIGKVKHEGRWDAAPGALVKLQNELNRRFGLRVPSDQKEVSLTDADLPNFPVLFIHGRNAFEFSPEERAALKQFVERGGLIFGDAVCASQPFAESFRQEMDLIWRNDGLKMERIPPEHEMFTTRYEGFDLQDGVTLLEPAAQNAGGPAKSATRKITPELEGIRLPPEKFPGGRDGRWGVVFSKYDLSCALEGHESIRCRGYTRDDAAKIGINVILYALHE